MAGRGLQKRRRRAQEPCALVSWCELGFGSGIWKNSNFGNLVRCGSSPSRWRNGKCSDGSGPRTFGPPGCGTRRPPPRPEPRPQLSTARCAPAPPAAPAAPPPPAPSSPGRAHVLSLWLSGEAPPHAGLPSLPTACHPPERAQDEKAQAGGRRRSLRRRRHTAGPHRHLRSRPRPTRSLTAQPYPTATSTHLAAVRLLAGWPALPTRTYRPWAGNKHPRLGTRVPATPGLVSTQPIVLTYQVGGIWPTPDLPVCLPHLPTFPTAYTHLPTHPRRRPTAPIPPDDATRPAPALPDRPLTPSPPSETAST